MRDLTTAEIGMVSGGWYQWDEDDDGVPPPDQDNWAENFYVPFDIYIDTNNDGIADGVVAGDQNISGTDMDNNEVPDFIDDFAMNYPPG